MKQLLDTHTFIWFVMGDATITPVVRSRIENNENLLSIVSVWEIAIKSNLGKLNLKLPFDLFMDRHVRQNAIQLLEVKLEHLSVVATLPLHHRDPFDRLLIAQVMVEQIPILGVDSAFDAYPIRRLWS